MLKIEFKSDVINTRRGNKNGNDWEINTQEGWILMKQPNGQASPFPEKVVFVLNKENGQVISYEVGMYEYDAEASLFIGDFNGLRLGRPVMRKVNKLQQAA